MTLGKLERWPRGRRPALIVRAVSSDRAAAAVAQTHAGAVVDLALLPEPVPHACGGCACVQSESSVEVENEQSVLMFRDGTARRRNRTLEG